VAVNSSLTLTYWHIGKRINSDVLQNERAGYGKQIVSILSSKLVEQYGKSFEVRNLRRMMQFTELFPDIEIVTPLVTQLSWTHIISLFPVKINEDGYMENDLESAIIKDLELFILDCFATKTPFRAKTSRCTDRSPTKAGK